MFDDGEYTNEILRSNASMGLAFANFKNLHELVKIVLNEDERREKAKKINHESFQFVRFIVIKF